MDASRRGSYGHVFDQLHHLKFTWQSRRKDVAKENIELHTIAQAIIAPSITQFPSSSPTSR